MQPKYEILSDEVSLKIEADRAEGTSPKLGFNSNNIIITIFYIINLSK